MTQLDGVRSGKPLMFYNLRVAVRKNSKFGEPLNSEDEILDVSNRTLKAIEKFYIDNKEHIVEKYGINSDLIYQNTFTGLNSMLKNQDNFLAELMVYSQGYIVCFVSEDDYAYFNLAHG